MDSYRAIQIIIKSTFKEGLDTPIDLAILDNRIQNREEACLGVLQGHLQFRKLNLIFILESLAIF
jgi:hypothetical protein